MTTAASQTVIRRGTTVLDRGAYVAFFAVVVLSPFRGRIDVVTRSRPPVYADFTNFLLSAGDIAMVATLALWLVSRRAQRRQITFGPAFVSWPVAALLVVAALGVPFSADPALSAYTTVRLIVLAAFALYVVNEIDHIRRLVAPVCVMVIVQGVVGVGQVVAQRSLSLGALGEHVLKPALGVSVVTTTKGVRVLRAYGLTDHPNILGGLIVLAALVIAGGHVAGPRAGAERHVLEPLALVVLALAGACAFLTFSRGSWIAAVAGVAILAIMVGFGPDRGALASVGVAAAALGLGVVPLIAPYHDVVAARTSHTATIATETRSIDEREAVNSVVSTILSDHPVLGVGVGALPLAVHAAKPTFRYDAQPAASVLLDVAAETGLVGGTAYLVVLVAPWVALIRNRRRWTAELAAASGALIAVTIIGTVDYYTWSYGAGRIWAWLVLGLWAAAFGRAQARAGGVPDV